MFSDEQNERRLMRSHMYKQFLIALRVSRDGASARFNVSGQIRVSGSDALPAMSFFISSNEIRSAEAAYTAGSTNAESWVDEQAR
jgi:hypothetical protein